MSSTLLIIKHNIRLWDVLRGFSPITKTGRTNGDCRWQRGYSSRTVGPPRGTRSRNDARALLANGVSCHLFTCLNSILEGAREKEKGSRMLKPLLPQQRKGVFQRCLPPSVLAEVFVKEVCHFGVLLGPGNGKQRPRVSETGVPTLQFSGVLW